MDRVTHISRRLPKCPHISVRFTEFSSTCQSHLIGDDGLVEHCELNVTYNGVKVECLSCGLVRKFADINDMPYWAREMYDAVSETEHGKVVKKGHPAAQK
jgi:hypothetical protein